jgi:outer membrane protein TolC
MDDARRSIARETNGGFRPVNQSPVNTILKDSSPRNFAPPWRRISAVSAIFLLQINLAMAAAPGGQAQAPQSQAPPAQAPQAPPPDSQNQAAAAPAASQSQAPAAQSPAPDAPPPQTGSAPTAPLPLAQEMQQEQRQASAPQQPFNVPMPHSHNPLFPYRPSTAPELNLSNSPRLENLIRNGKIYVSLRDAIAVAIENNLDLAYFRYNFPIAQTDIQRTKSGAQANGVNAIVTQSTQGGFSSSSGGGGGGSSGGSAAAGAGGIVTSTLGAGTSVSSFDPYLNFNGFVNHTTTPEPNAFQIGTALFKTNTIEVLSNFSQSFPIGTNISATYQGERYATNSPDFSINPELFSNFQLQITQPLLAGFGLATNERYIRIAKRNAQITDLVFKQQVIATVTQVENIYWDLVNAYQSEQINERSLGFANQTLSDDQKQLELNAIPAMQVMTDQAAVATAEGNLTVARASLRLNELLMKNVLTKVDDPMIDEMPVVPLDLHAEPDPNAGKSIDDLIAEAEKKRPEVAIYQMQAEVQKQALKDINSELLPSLNVYGLYGGQGVAGPKNPNCNVAQLGPDCSSDLPTGFPSMFANTFNYSAPEYQVGMTLSINLRNREYKADQFRAVLAYRQSQISSVQQQKNILFDVRNSKFALEQDQARVEAAQKTRDLAQRTFDITKQEQQLGAKSSVDTLVAENALAVAESALDTAQSLYEKAKVDIDRAIGDTLERTGVSIDDAKAGVVTHAP